MKKIQVIILFLILIGLSENTIAQSSFRKLARPEKCWVICHPFKARKAQKITKEVQIVVDSIKQSGIIGKDSNGGSLDAFKHAYWMACLTRKIGEKNARKLGIAHEKGNYLEFKKHQLEDKILPDSISCEMDLNNNEIGIRLAKRGFGSMSHLKGMLLMSADENYLYTIKKDENGNFLTCEGKLIELKEWSGKWNIPKCLVLPIKSNQPFPRKIWK